jgi:hypothetical protein
MREPTRSERKPRAGRLGGVRRRERAFAAQDQDNRNKTGKVARAARSYVLGTVSLPKKRRIIMEYAVFLPAFYIPVLLLLLGLISRGATWATGTSRILFAAPRGALVRRPPDGCL